MGGGINSLSYIGQDDACVGSYRFGLTAGWMCWGEILQRFASPHGVNGLETI